MQVITIAGNLGRDAELRSTQGGDTVLSFSLGVRNGFGRDAGTNWYRCSVWGQRAKSLDGMLRKGMQCFVTGALTIGEYQGKPQFDVRVSELDFTKLDGGVRQDRSDGVRQHQGGFPDDDSDSVPF